MKKIFFITLLFSINIYTNQVENNPNIIETQKLSPKEENVKKIVHSYLEKEELRKLANTMTQNLYRSTDKNKKNLPVATKLVDKIVEKWSSPECIKEYTQVYCKYFDDKDIKAIVDFYESNTGKKILKAKSQLDVDCNQIMMKIVYEVITEFLTNKINNIEIKN